ncbi:ATP-binding protein [Hoeflea sp. AS60]|uniref:ATP-binding protein n=1 Tax=Hoeflea sp. AS60 TaxID=3135780 RepID=UPI00317C7547
MPAHHYPFIDLAVHASVRDHFARGNAVAVLSRDLGEVLWANGAAAQLFGFSNIYDILDEGFGGQTSTRRQIESAVSGLERTGRPQNFMMRATSGFSRTMAPATLEDFTLPDGEQALMLTSSQAGQALGPIARARQIIAGFEGTGTHVAVLDEDAQVLAASSTFDEIGLAGADIQRMVADVAGAVDRLVKRMTDSPNGAMPTAIGRLADDPVLHLLFAVEPAPADETPFATGETAETAEEVSAGDVHSEDALYEAPSDTGEKSDAAPTFETETSTDTETVTESIAETPSENGTEAADEPEAIEEAPTRTFFDTRRIRDELNARLAKAEQENDLPAAFADARGLEFPSETEETSEDDTANHDDEAADHAPETSGDDMTASSEEAPSDHDETSNTEEHSSEGEISTQHETDSQGDDTATGDDESADLTPESSGEDMTASSQDAPSDHDETSSIASDADEGDTSTQYETNGEDDDTATRDDESADLTPETSGEEIAASGDEVASDQDGISVRDENTGEGESSRQDETAGQDDQPAVQEVADKEPLQEAAAAVPEFQFDPAGKPARFVWKINRDGEFSEVSPEFAAAVGPHSADIVGRKFPDLARVFNLDPDHVISDLLNRRDTWSGKTVLWPIQGTDLVTPVDLAALPTYTRDRHFDGFRGFGIVRTSETRPDPEALGLALVPGSVSRSIDDIPLTDDLTGTEFEDDHGSLSPDLGDTDGATAEDDADLEMRDLERDIDDLSRMDGVHDEPTDKQSGTDDANLDVTDDADAEETGNHAADPFRGERPAIRLVETPMRRDSDKVINLEAHRPRMPRESLSPGEQAAFREIGVRLGKTSQQDTGAPDKAEQSRSESAPPALPREPQTFGKRQAPENDQSGAGDSSLSSHDDHVDQQSDLPQTGADADMAGNSADEARSDAVSPAQAEETQTAALAALPSAFALPARQVMPAGMDAGIIDAIPAALLVHAGDELIHGNAEFFELTGYASLEELAGHGGLDHLLERSSEEQPSNDSGLFVRRGDGGRRGVTARLRSVNWGNGQALLLALSPREVSTAHAAEVPTLTPQDESVDEPEPDFEAASQVNALQIEAQELRSILETATDGVVILNNDGTIRSMNGSACALFNYDETETHSQPFAMLFAHESQRAVMDYVSGLADHGVSSVLNDGREVIGREASGGFLPLFMTIGRLSGSNGYCAVLRDITQWKRTEEELRNAKRAAETANSHKSDFLARVSHEVRTPLNAIIGFSEMMVEERFGPIGSPRYLEYAHDIGNSGKHVLDIVNDLLDISKIEAGQVSMEFVSVSLNDHLAESVSLLQPMANSQRVIIRTSLSASVPDVVADQRSIKQIALNLLSNAIRYTPSGGQIVVSTSYEPSGNVVIRIRDTGIGMNRKELEQAMKPFGQVGPGPRQRGDGTGLGLPLTKAMVEANRAQFDIVSAPGEGTLVSIAFPPQRVLAD